MSDIDWKARAEAAESRLDAIDAYRGEAEKVAETIKFLIYETFEDETKVFNGIRDALLAARMEGAEATESERGTQRTARIGSCICRLWPSRRWQI